MSCSLQEATIQTLARILVNDTDEYEAVPGDLFGRHWSAAIRFDDARVSEAHAMLSLRGGSLKLLALRGALRVEGQVLSDVTLREGMTIVLAPEVSMRIEEVLVPASVLAITGPGQRAQVLTSSSYSIQTVPRPKLRAGFQPDAAALLWRYGDTWHARVGDEQTVEFGPATVLDVCGYRFAGSLEDVVGASHIPTVPDQGLHQPLRILTFYDSVNIERNGSMVLAFGGLAARIVAELAEYSTPVDWEVVAREIWDDSSDRYDLRRRWDAILARLRRKLRAADVRPNLVTCNGSGLVTLVLGPKDEVVNKG